MAFTITCPTGGLNVLVTNMKICVTGTSPTTRTDKGTVIRLKVVTRGSPAPNPTAGGTDVGVAPNWCARNVPVPGNGNLTLYAWQELVTSSGSTWGPAQTVDFVGGGANPTDCCSGCTSASALVGELAESPTLEVTVPQGPQAGRYKASPTAPLVWAMSVGGINYELRCDSEAMLMLCRHAEFIHSSSVEGGPFSATFPGAVFESADEVVVTLA